MEGGIFMWVYHSPIGDLVVKLWTNGRYALLHNGECYGFWATPQAAADEVYTHTTGCSEWDALDCQVDDVPTDLSEWEKI